MRHDRKVLSVFMILVIVILSITIIIYELKIEAGFLIASTPVTGESGSNSRGWNSNIVLKLENIGVGPVTITNIIINGKPYNSFNPVPIVDPSIENGYTVKPFQTVTMMIKLINQPSALFQGANELYVLTKGGQSLRVYLGS